MSAEVSAPVALFVYSRVEHAQQAVQSLLLNPEAPETELIVFSDGPRGVLDAKAVAEVRGYIASIRGFKGVRIYTSPINKGLARSIIDGVSQVLKQSNMVIVLEDDLVVSPYFLQYMNSGLRLYKNETRVASIHGYCYPMKRIEGDTFFLRGADCWGWATWRRAWDNFEPDGKRLLSKLAQEGLMRKFDLDGAYPYVRMLKNQIKGKNNSWAIRWHASCFIKNMMTLYPSASLVQNIGNDNSGTHCNTTNSFNVDLAEHPILVKKIEINENQLAKKQVAIFFKGERSLFRRMLSKLKSVLANLGI